MQSLNSPITPFTQSTLDRNFAFGFTNENMATPSMPNGMSSLADELGEADWDEDEETLEEGEEEASNHTNGVSNGLNGHAGNTQDTPGYSRSPASKRRWNRRRSTRSNISGLSNESEDIDESLVMSPELDQQIAEVERLSNQDFSQIDKSQNVFYRIEEELKDLGSQANIESHATRYVPPSPSFAVAWLTFLVFQTP